MYGLLNIIYPTLYIRSTIIALVSIYPIFTSLRVRVRPPVVAAHVTWSSAHLFTPGVGARYYSWHLLPHTVS